MCGDEFGRFCGRELRAIRSCLGIQFNWTAQCQEALEKSKQNKAIVQDREE